MSTILRVQGVSAESSSWEVEGWCTHALERISFEVREGEIVVILGAPGAGKTMLIRVILGLLEPSTGEVKIFGLPPTDWMWKPEVGYVPQCFCPQTAWSARAFLGYVAEVREILWGNRVHNHVEKLLDQVGLSQFSDTPVRVFSRDMMVRLGLAQAFLHNPRLLVLDEPANGAGSEAVENLRKLLVDFRSRGGAVLLSAQRAGDLELSADRFLILQEGRVVFTADPDTFESGSHELRRSRNADSMKPVDSKNQGSSLTTVRDSAVVCRTIGEKAEMGGSENRWPDECYR